MNEKIRICIIGAGIAGLVAAKELLKSGKNLEIDILEAADYCGGRILTHTAPNGDIIEHGANYVHDLHKNNPLYNYCESDNPLFLTKTIGFDEAEILTDKFHIRNDEFRDFCNKIKNLEDQLILDAEFNSLPNGYDKALFISKKYKDSLNSHHKNEEVIDLMLNTFFMYKSEWMDLEICRDHFIYTDTYGHTKPYDVIVYNGYDKIIKQTLDSIPSSKIQNNSKVIAIHKANNGINVDYLYNGKKVTWSGDFVINTVSLGVLKSGAIKFFPELSKEKQAAITNLEMVKTRSMSLTFRRDSFEEAMNDVEKPFCKPYIALNTSEVEMFIINLNFFHLPQIRSTSLRIFFPNKYAKFLDKYNEGELKSYVVRYLSKHYKSLNEENLIDYSYKNWNKEELFCGAYSCLGKNGNDSTWVDYAKSEYDGRLLMAGEACIVIGEPPHIPNRVHISTVDGAMLSAIAAANNILKTI